MKASELRINSWYNYKGKEVQLSLEDFYEVEYNLLKILKPIQLNSVWLMKFGAQLFPWGFVINEFLIAWNKKDTFWIEVGNGKRIELPYVHTVQNFFALTGKELTIK